jgi:hypothetical protein
VAETLRGRAEKAKAVRSTLAQILMHRKGKTVFDMFGSELPDEVFEDVFEQPRQRDWHHVDRRNFWSTRASFSEICERDRAHPKLCPSARSHRVEEVGRACWSSQQSARAVELKRRRNPQQTKAADRRFSAMRARLGDRVLPIDDPIAQCHSHCE